jgi:tRNA-2-methylthio-N6-dimethylallyladenosine synthase
MKETHRPESPQPVSAKSSPKVSSYHVKSFGCQMNVYDSERMGDLLAAEGHVAVDSAENADIVVLNTCHIREKAAEKLYSDIGRMRKPRADGGRRVIVAAGCVAQAEGAEIGRRAPAVDIIVGPLAYHRLPELLREAAAIPEDARGARWGRAIDTDMPASPKFDHLPARRHEGASAFLTVQEGCDKFCTFCVVPYTRGGETSRPQADLVAEAKALVAAGAVEITLIGQNVNAYNGVPPGAYDGGSEGADSLPGLIARLAELPGLKRIRYTTSHPRDMTQALIDAHVDIPKLMPYLHLPVQSGSSRILKAMNRAHTRDSYLATLARLRVARPDIAISGDFIVGFPGETEADFADTLRIVAEVGYAQAYSFKYSQRPGTPAATMADQVPEPVKEERLARLQAAITAGAYAFNKASVGRRTEILLERAGRKPGQLIGKTPWLQSAVVEIPGAKIGDLVAVEITAGQPNSVEAIPLSLQAERTAA